jgi:hypothetical protein
MCTGGPTVRAHCCRRDNPGYELPTVGSWQPVYGQLGVRNTDGRRMECHACGGWYVSVGSHSWHFHDLAADEYKAAFGLTRQGLIGEALRAEYSARQLRTVAIVGHVVIPQATPEQRAAHFPLGIEARARISANGRAHPPIVARMVAKTAQTA